MQTLVVVSAITLVFAGLLMITLSFKVERRGDILWYIGWVVFSIGFATLTIICIDRIWDLFYEAQHPKPILGPIL